MESGWSCRIHRGLSNNLYTEQNQPNPRIDNHFFEILSNIVLPFTPRPSYRFLSCRLTC